MACHSRSPDSPHPQTVALGRARQDNIRYTRVSSILRYAPCCHKRQRRIKRGRARRAGNQRLSVPVEPDKRSRTRPASSHCRILLARIQNLFEFLPSWTPSLPPEHPLQLQPSPLDPRPRRRRVEVPHQVIVVRRIAPGLQHSARGGLGGRGGRVLVEVPVPQEGDESVDLCCWVRVGVGPGELVGLGQAF